MLVSATTIKFWNKFQSNVFCIVSNVTCLPTGVIAGGLVGLLFAVFLVGFMLYRMKKKDEGSYSLDEPKQSNGGYQKPQKQEEFYA